RPAGADALLRQGRQLVQVVVAGGHLVPAGGNADLRPSEVVLGEADGPEHRARRRPLRALRDLPAPRAIGSPGHGTLLDAPDPDGSRRGRARRWNALTWNLMCPPTRAAAGGSARLWPRMPARRARRSSATPRPT